MSHQASTSAPEKPRSRLSLNKKTLFQQKLFTATVKHEGESVKPVDTRFSVPFCGLVNLGNTCYINSILQVLRFCPGFTKSVQNLTQPEPPRASKPHLIAQLNELLRQMAQLEAEKTAESHSPVLSPTNFVNQLKDSHAMFSGNGQHDAQELLKVLLVGIQEMTTIDDAQSRCPPAANREEKPAGPEPLGCCRKRERFTATKRGAKKRVCLRGGPHQHIMTEYVPSKSGPTKPGISHEDNVQQEEVGVGAGLFQGNVTYRTVCIECESSTQGTETFLDLSIPVVGSHGFDHFGQQSSPVKAPGLPAMVGPYSLSWALSQFAKRERLHSNNKYWCGHCGHLVEAERSVLLSKLPPVLTIHLNRFSMQSVSVFSRVGKITGNIATPLSLCLSPWCTPECPNRLHMYALFAVVFHTGSSCHGGHYTACVRARNHHSYDAQPTKGDWLLFDDDHVVPITQAKLVDMLSPLSTSCATAYILFYA